MYSIVHVALSLPNLDAELGVIWQYCKGNPTRDGYNHNSLAEGDPKYIRHITQKKQHTAHLAEGDPKRKD